MRSRQHRCNRGPFRFKNLKVSGVAMNDVAPNTRVDLPALAFGDGSLVLLYALGPDPENKTGTTSQASAAGQSGTFAADLTVRTIQVHITDLNSKLLPGTDSLDVTVSDAAAHSQYNGTRCHDNEVSGHAFIASAKVPQPDRRGGGLRCDPHARRRAEPARRQCVPWVQPDIADVEDG